MRERNTSIKNSMVIRMSKAKYEKGEQITSVAEFENCKSRWYKWRDATRHRGVIESLQYHTLKSIIDNGYLYVAKEKSDEEQYGNKA